jgi:RNA polymerase sigma factor (sigma-70 family)
MSTSTAVGTKRASTAAGLPHRPVFVTTHWSLVLAASNLTSPQSIEALENLCRAYWYPLYAYVRRLGHSPHDAEDLTQEFFARLLARNYLEAADRKKGRFRTFLLTALKRFLAKEWERARAQKRGGGNRSVPLDSELAERLYRTEPGVDLPPDRLYERRCALVLLDAAFQRLAQEFADAEKSGQFEVLKPYLTAVRGEIPYEELANRLNLDEGAARVMVHRFRKRYRELFREEIARTVVRPDEIEDEMRHLFAALSG